MNTKTSIFISSLAFTLIFSGVFVLRTHAATISGSNTNFLPNTGLTQGLIGWWTFDGKDMINNVRDSSGQGNTGYLKGFTSTTTVPGKIGQGLNFNGTSNYVETSASAFDFGRTSTFTLSAWVKRKNSAVGNMPAIMGNFNVAGNTGYNFIFCDVANCFFGGEQANTVAFYAGNTTYATYTVTSVAGSAINNGAWQHYAVTYAGPTVVSLYVNGVNQATVSSINFPSGTYASGAPLRIGDDNTGDWITGSMDDVRIYNRVLSATEVKQLYNVGAATKQAVPAPVNTTTSCTTGLSCGLVGYWTFDGKDMINNLNDVTRGGSNGSLSGFTSTSSAVTPGKIGQGLNFVGANSNYISLPTTGTALNTITDQSICVWVKTASASNAPYIYNNRSLSAGGVSLRINNTGKPAIVVKSTVSTAANTSVADGYWHNVCATFASSTASSAISYYRDGVPDGTTSSSVVLGFGISKYIGACNCGGLSNFLTGTLDELRIYNRVLSDVEIQQLYNSGAATKQAISAPVTTTTSCTTGLSCGLAGYWTFDGKDMANGVALDKSGNGNSGNTANIATSTFYTRGKIGQAINPDGVDDEIVVPSVLGVTANNSITLLSWVYISRTSESGAFIKLGLNTAGAGNNNGFGIGVGASTFDDDGNDIIGLYENVVWRDTNVTIGTGWHHIVMRVNSGSNSTSDYFKDGVLVASLSAATAVAPTTKTFLGGYTGAGGENRHGNYVVDDARVYNRALSNAEILQLYNAGR